MAMRKLPIGTRSIMGYFASVKNKRSIPHMSLIERDYFLFLEFDDNVASYEEQPFEIKVSVNGKIRIFKPDCLVFFKPELFKKSLLVEIKPDKELKDEKKSIKLLEKFSIIQQYAADNGMDFDIITDKKIRTQYFENIKFLYRYSEAPQNYYKYFDKILSLIERNGSISVSNLLKELAENDSERALILPSIWHMLFSKAIITDLNNKPLTNNTLLEAKDGNIIV